MAKKSSTKPTARRVAKSASRKAPKPSRTTKATARKDRGANNSGTAKIKPGSRGPQHTPVTQPVAPPVIIPRPVATDARPRKNQVGLSAKELEHYRELLLQKRRELVGDMSSMEREALRTANTNLSSLPLHMADMGTDNYEQEFTLGLVEKDRQLLREINRALVKTMDGTYGICEGTGKPISKPRLEAQPWARYSIDYARQMERGGVRR